MATPPDTRPQPRPKVERLPPLPPAKTNYHHTRKRIHLLCFQIFVALPFFNVMRFDIPRQRFYFAGFELWINEFGILFFSLMFLMFLVAASALIHGRVYCSYMCPQMIFSEWSLAVEAWALKKTKPNKLLGRLLFFSILWVASVFLAFVFTAYFVEPRDLIQRLARLDMVTAGGITGATVTLLTFLDFTLLRQKFCTTVCPYGYLQGMLQDKHTLLVAYQDGAGPQKVCIECKKCVRVCHMDIDIRTSPFQIECVHCGECIDACEDVLRRIGKPGLIHYSWGENPPTPEQAAKEPWYFRLGFRDAKRVVILLVLMFYITGLGLALSMRRPVLVRVAADRTTLFTVGEDGRIANRMRMTLANRSSQPVAVALSVENLPGAELVLDQNPIPLAPGASLEKSFDLRVARWPGSSDVNRFRFVARPSNGDKPDVFDLTFILPYQKGK